MFFIARIVAAMLTGSWGSYSTTRTEERIESRVVFESLEVRGAPPLIPLDAKCCPPLPAQRMGRTALRREKKAPRAGELPLDYWPAGDKAVDDNDHRNYEQKVNQAAAHVNHEEPKNPKDEEN